MKSIRVLDRFQLLFRPLTQAEYNQLEENILKEGIRDPLVLWGNILVDGHNRYSIAKRHGLRFKTVQMEFQDETEAEIWIRSNQKGRRNFTRLEQLYNMGKLYELTKERHGGDRKSGKYKKSSIQNESLKKTAQKIAKDNNLSEATILRAAEFSGHVDMLLGIDQKITNKMLSGEIRATRKDIKVLANMDPAKRKAVIKKLYENPVFSQARKTVEITMVKEAVTQQTIKESKRKPPEVYNLDCVDFIAKCKPYDLMLTDPPYITDIKDMASFIGRWLYPALAKMKKTGVAYIFIGAYPEEVKAYLNAEIPPDIVLKQILVWTYKNVPMKKQKFYRRNYTNILLYCHKSLDSLNIEDISEQWAVMEENHPDGRRGNKYSGYQKPIELAEMLIRHSTKKNAIVIDPFVCTGTSILAASKLGRIGIGADISKENLQIAISRGCVLK